MGGEELSDGEEEKRRKGEVLSAKCYVFSKRQQLNTQHWFPDLPVYAGLLCRQR